MNTSMTYVSGTTEAKAKVQVYAGSKKIGEGYAMTNGTFQVNVAKQRKGSALEVRVSDSSGNQRVQKVTVQ